MATSEDEFDPPLGILDALVAEILAPSLARASEQIGCPYRARIAVWVRDIEIPKYSIAATGRSSYDIDENVDVRVRFRKTIKPTRHLYSIVTEHAEAWRRHQLSGLWIKGDIVFGGEKPRIRVRQETTCYTGGWQRW